MRNLKWNMVKIRKTGFFNTIKQLQEIEDELKNSEKGDNNLYDIKTYEELAEVMRSFVETFNEDISKCIEAVSEIND